MTVTSIELAMNNYTQVERIGAKQAVHILAILKPPGKSIVRLTNEPVFQPFYKEITYPLDAGVPPNPDYYQPADMPRTKIFSHARQAEPFGNPSLLAPGDICNTLAAPTQGPDDTPSNSAVSTVNSSLGAQAELSGVKRENCMPIQGALPQSEPTAHPGGGQDPSTKERVSERDLQATRTFAILPMLQAGDNPWDLGSWLLNFKTVMGVNLLDWLLPIRRSPCCNHEDTTSQYAIGPGVDLLRSSVGFIPSRDTGTLHRRRRRRRTRESRRTENEPDADGRSSGPNLISGETNLPIPLQNINNSSTAPQTAGDKRFSNWTSKTTSNMEVGAT
jgi:palmitoyltransferase